MQQRKETKPVERLAYTVNDFCRAVGFGRTKTYELINSGQLKTVYVGGRRLITTDLKSKSLGSGSGSNFWHASYTSSGQNSFTTSSPK
jgi:hypothetical protein